MKNLRSWRWIFATSLILGAAPGVYGKDWIRAESAHFIAYSNISEVDTRGYIRQLESFKFLTELMLGASSQSAASSAKFTLYLLNDQEQLDVIRPGLSKLHYAGVYLHCSEGAADFSWTSKSFDSSGDDEALMIIQHEYAHHLMFSHLNYFMPRWYVEGFAEYLSTVALRRGKFDVGSSASGRIYTLMNGSSWIDFRILLDTRKYLELLSRKKVDEGHFYAQSWLLTHYMLSDTSRTKAINQYFDQIGHGADPIASFESTTGIPVDKLDRILQKYLTNLSRLSVGVPEIPDSSIAITRIAPEQSDYIIENAALQTCPANDYGQRLLENLRTLRSKHARETDFRLAIDRAELLYGNISSIQSDLEQIVSSDPANFTAHYLLGRTYYQVSMDAKQSDPSLLDNARQEFIAAYKLDRLNAVNLYYFAKVLNTDAKDGAPSRNLVNAASGAAYFMPSVYEYAVLAADVNMRNGNRDQAIHALQPFACNPHDPEHAAGVSRVIAALASGKTFYEAMNAFNKSESTEEKE